jgi:hypothetical protein
MGKLTTIKKLFKCFMYVTYQISNYTLRLNEVVAFFGKLLASVFQCDWLPKFCNKNALLNDVVNSLTTSFSHHHPF